MGDVGCGKGTTCHGLKGGVGSSSRIFELDGKTYTIGALVQTNHGRLADLRIDGKPVGREINKTLNDSKPDKGSCIVIIATDLPVSSRQLRRIIKRASIGLIRNGSYLGHGSGDVFVGFSTANRLYATEESVRSVELLNENKIDIAFRACGECVEEAVLSSMLNAHTVKGYGGNVRLSLSDFIG